MLEPMHHLEERERARRQEQARLEAEIKAHLHDTPTKLQMEWETEKQPRVAPGYEPLAQVLQEALDQAQGGKGHERHSNGLPFIQQPIMAESRLLGPGGLVFQARKKLLEAATGIHKRPEAAMADLLGAINYTAALLLYYREQGVPKNTIEDLTL